MKADNPVESLAQAFYTALAKDLPTVEETMWQPKSEIEKGILPKIRQRRPTSREVLCYHFPQMWGSTALGFGGMGGAAMTEAYTTVVAGVYGGKEIACVYFDGRIAYIIESPNNLFWEDVKTQAMKGVSEMHRYELTQKPCHPLSATSPNSTVKRH